MAGAIVPIGPRGLEQAGGAGSLWTMGSLAIGAASTAAWTQLQLRLTQDAPTAGQFLADMAYNQTQLVSAQAVRDYTAVVEDLPSKRTTKKRRRATAPRFLLQPSRMLFSQSDAPKYYDLGQSKQWAGGLNNVIGNVFESDALCDPPQGTGPQERTGRAVRCVGYDITLIQELYGARHSFNDQFDPGYDLRILLVLDKQANGQNLTAGDLFFPLLSPDSSDYFDPGSQFIPENSQRFAILVDKLRYVSSVANSAHSGSEDFFYRRAIRRTIRLKGTLDVVLSMFDSVPPGASTDLASQDLRLIVIMGLDGRHNPNEGPLDNIGTLNMRSRTWFLT